MTLCCLTSDTVRRQSLQAIEAVTLYKMRRCIKSTDEGKSSLCVDFCSLNIEHCTKNPTNSQTVPTHTIGFKLISSLWKKNFNKESQYVGGKTMCFWTDIKTQTLLRPNRYQEIIQLQSCFLMFFLIPIGTGYISLGSGGDFTPKALTWVTLYSSSANT